MIDNKRIGIIEEIEANLNSRLLVYITGDRRGLETKISTDIFPIFHKHLMQIGHQNRIVLFLYSVGGIAIAGYTLVNLIREFCDEFDVIIPFKALSCATLIAIGANRIIMTPMGQLSPIDPSIEHPLGPIVQLPGQPIGRISPVSVEDVNAFVDLARTEVGLKDESSMKMVLELLASKVHPLVLGAVQRTREQITFLASNLMKFHCVDPEKTERLLKALIRERFSHNYIISRREAKEVLGLNIVDPDDKQTELIVALLGQYNEIMKLDIPYNPETTLAAADNGVFSFDRAIIESKGLAHIFRTSKEIRRLQLQQPGIPIPVMGYQERVLQEEWVEDKPTKDEAKNA